jgi:tetratricopeptide (TPR) repeat protein
LEALRQAAKVAPKEPALDLRLPQLMAEGRKLLEKLDFSGAQAKFESAAKLPGPAKERDAAEQWGRKAQEFAIATAHIQASAYATAETSYRLVSHEGGEHIGLVLRETAGEVHFQRVPAENPATLGRAIVVIPKAELAAVFPVGLAERREELRRFLKRAEAGADLAGAAQAGDYYDLVFLSRRLDLGPECLQYLERAYEKAPNGWLGQAFRQVVLDRAVQRAALLAAANNKYQAEKALAEMEAALKDYPPAREEAQRFRAEILSKLKPDHKTTISFKTRPVEYAQPKTPSKAPPQTASARELAAAAESAAVGEIVVNSTGVSGRNQAAARYVEEANRKFEEAMPFYQQFLRGLRGAQANQALDRAEKLFDASVDLYGKALEVDKSNRSVESRQVEASMLAYACRKAKSLR